MRKDEEEQRKLVGKSGGNKTTRTARSTNKKSGRSGSNIETKKEKEEREKEEDIQRLVIRDQLAGDPDL